MASKRTLKKQIKSITYDVLDEADYLIESGHKGADKADKLMDEAADFYEEMVAKVNAAKIKKEFKAVAQEVEAAGKKFTDKLNSIE